MRHRGRRGPAISRVASRLTIRPTGSAKGGAGGTERRRNLLKSLDSGAKTEEVGIWKSDRAAQQTKGGDIPSPFVGEG
jgi:hypothetical protein